MSPETKRKRKVKRTIKKRIRKLGERKFLKKLLREIKIIYWCVENENIPCNLDLFEVNQYIVQNKMLGIAVKYIFQSYGIDIKVPVMGRLDMEIAEDYDIAFDNMYLLSDVGRLFDYKEFSLFGFETCYLGKVDEDVEQSFEKLSKAIHKISGESTKRWLDDEPEITFCYLLYHPCYKRFSDWVKINSSDNVFNELYRTVNNRLEVIHNGALGILLDTCEAGAVFPIYYHYGWDDIFESDESTFHLDSIFAAFVLQCLILVAERRDFHK